MTTLLFLLGAPRSGTTMLERVLSSHSMIRGGPEPHLLTPLAHLGVWANVGKAPYDHIVAALGQKAFVEQLPAREADYWAACRAYSQLLYDRYMLGTNKTVCLDKTPEYATVLPFLCKVWPDAKYVVLTRHPAAVFASFANSFFDGDFEITQAHDPIVERYVPALAAFLRQSKVPFLHVRYEDFVQAPGPLLKQIHEYVGVPYEPETLDYSKAAGSSNGLGDPIGVKQYKEPSTQSLDKWADELAAEPAKFAFLKSMLARVDPADLARLGYPAETLWQPVEARLASGTPRVRARRKLDRYALERKAIVRGRALVQRSQALRKLVDTVRLTCDVLLREY